jgi:hypothetical protein
VPRDTVFPIDNCLTVESDPISNWNSEGILILGSTEDIENNLMRRTGYKINMNTGERVELAKSEERLSDMAVSLNGEWLAYRIYSASNKNANLVISNATSGQQLSIPWENEWYWIASWLDENRLLIGVGANAYMVFNPFTNERLLLNSELPSIFSAQGFNGLVGWGYSRDLDRVVYLQGDPSFLEPLHYVLWDIDQHRSLASFAVAIEPTAFPSWLPDGSKFVLAASIKEDILQTWPAYELYSLSRDGQIAQLTSLTDYYPWVYIDNYSWSPNGRYIAFWFSNWSNEKPGWELQAERYLAVVDTETMVVTNYCIPGKLASSGRTPAPVWSPNGKQLVVESPNTDGHSQVVLVDLERYIAVKIGEDMTPRGWMVLP